jgi:hypothetical protein
MKIIHTGSWHWFGGYHIFVQQFFVSGNGFRFSAYEQKYNYSSDWWVLLYVCAAILLGIGTYALASTLLKNYVKKAPSSTSDKLENKLRARD